MRSDPWRYNRDRLTPNPLRLPLPESKYALLPDHAFTFLAPEADDRIPPSSSQRALVLRLLRDSRVPSSGTPNGTVSASSEIHGRGIESRRV